jgi:hypothetical protein
MSVSLSKVFSARPGWYCGDFHAHTTCSDGVFSPLGLNELAVKHGLDFLSITDHNAIGAFDDFDESLEHMILPGIEITLLDGHFNVFGFEGITEQAREFFHSIVDLPLEFKFRQHWDHAKIADFMKRIKDAGFIIDLAHPLLWPWEWRDHDTEIAYFNCIELINDPTYRDNPAANPSARRMWDAWLNAGYRITAVGGTDFHSLEPSDDPTRISRLNLPLTYVYARELSGQAILEGVARHHVFVSVGPHIEFQAQMDGKTFMMGDDLGPVQSTVRLFAMVDGCEGPVEACLVRNGKVVTRVPVQDGKAEIEWQVQPGDVKDSNWFRFDVINPEDQMAAVSNPFFFGPESSDGISPYGRFLGGYVKA